MSGNNNYIHKQIWKLDEDVNVRIKYEQSESDTAYSKDDLIQYLEETLDEIKLNFVFSDKTMHETKGGIQFYFRRSGSGDAFGTTKVTAYTKEFIGSKEVWVPYDFMSIKIDLGVLDQVGDPDRQKAFLNICLHEFLHALGLGHIKFLKDAGMPLPLMVWDFNNFTELVFSYSEKQALTSLYGERGMNLTFEDQDLGKTAFVIPKKRDKYKSFSFQITDKEMFIEGLPKKFRVVVR